MLSKCTILQFSTGGTTGRLRNHPRFKSHLTDLSSRADLRHAQRIVIKCGTSTTTDHDGYPALRRVTSLIEQIALLRREKKEVVLVASGAVGYGRCVQRRQRILMSSAMSLLYDTENKAASVGSGKNVLAAMGQSAFMSTLSMLFNQLDTATGQLLLTHHDFLSKDRTENLVNTLNGFMENGVVPVVNENDAVTYDMKRDEAGFPFGDNDGLACLVASHIGADLVIFLTDVDGLYDRSPDDENAKFISTWVPSQQAIKFGEKSTMGRGGMQSKVDSAMKALGLGIPAAVICSGQRHGTILNILEGQKEGTLFVKNPERLAEESSISVNEIIAAAEGRQAKEPEQQQQPNEKQQQQQQQQADDSAPPSTPEETKIAETMRAQAVAAREGGRALLSLTSSERAHIINCVADALQQKIGFILEANAIDMERESKAATPIAAPLLARLKLNEAKIKILVDGVRSLASTEEPVGRVQSKMQMADGAVLRQETTPIGVINVIFESRPDSLVQIAALTLRSCNGLLLKGGKEAVRSNAALHKVIVDAISNASGGKVPRGVIGLVESRAEVGELLKLDKEIDLVIPRGSNQLVKSIKSSTRIPVLGHADGICHTYVDKTVAVDAETNAPDNALKVLLDAKLQYPAACNATETVLIDKNLEPAKIRFLLQSLTMHGVELRGGPEIRELFPVELPHAAASFEIEYGDNQLCVELVDGVQAAIQHINRHGSHHTDSILSDDPAICKTFIQGVDSACVFQNASTRMADGYRFGLGAEVGISTGRIHARGPVGVAGLLSSKWVLEVPSVVNLITAQSFADGEKEYLHKALPL